MSAKEDGGKNPPSGCLEKPRLIMSRCTRRSAIADCTARHVWTWNVHPSYWWSVPLGANFTGTGSSHAKMLIPFDG